jgi:hypothetical protein
MLVFPSLRSASSSSTGKLEARTLDGLKARLAAG